MQAPCSERFEEPWGRPHRTRRAAIVKFATVSLQLPTHLYEEAYGITGLYFGIVRGCWVMCNLGFEVCSSCGFRQGLKPWVVSFRGASFPVWQSSLHLIAARCNSVPGSIHAAGKIACRVSSRGSAASWTQDVGAALGSGP